MNQNTEIEIGPFCTATTLPKFQTSPLNKYRIQIYSLNISCIDFTNYLFKKPIIRRLSLEFFKNYAIDYFKKTKMF